MAVTLSMGKKVVKTIPMELQIYSVNCRYLFGIGLRRKRPERKPSGH